MNAKQARILVTGAAIGLTFAIGTLFGSQAVASRDDADLARGTKVVAAFVGSDKAIDWVRTEQRPFGRHYEYVAGGGSYWVKDGELVGFVAQVPETQKVTVTQEAAKNSAQTFAAKQFRHANLDDLTLLTSELNDHGSWMEYHFYWRRVVDTVQYPEFVDVRVDPATGRVFAYNSGYRQVTKAPKPEVTREKASEVARAQFHGLGVAEVQADLWPTQKGDLLFRWHLLSQVRTREDGTVEGYHATVDGMTGQVLSVTGF